MAPGKPGRTAMALRDHFRPPLSDFRDWEDFHGGWTFTIRGDLNRRLPEGYFAVGQTHLGPLVEVDVGTFKHVQPTGNGPPVRSSGGTELLEAPVWAPPAPLQTLA